MNFCEDNTNIVELYNFNQPIIYFLLNDDEVVYVGQSKNGIARPVSHCDKVFNRIKILPCKMTELNYLEDIYIVKYKPKYNLEFNKTANLSLQHIRGKLIKYFDMDKTTISTYDVKKLLTILKLTSTPVCDCTTLELDKFGQLCEYIQECKLVINKKFNKNVLNDRYNMYKSIVTNTSYKE